MARILHFSDTHLGHQQYARTDPSSGLNQREQDHYDAFNHVIEHAITTRPDLVIHAGDLFDGVRPSNRALAVALRGFLRLSKANIPVVVIAGNHEHPKLAATGSPFALFDHLDGVRAVYQGEVESFDVAGMHVHAVPQCANNDELAKQIAALQRVPDVPNVLVVHGAVHSLEAFKHAEFNELSLDPEWFDQRFDYVAIGHFHSKAQVRANAWYCGAPDRVSIAEAGEPKGFLEIDVEVGRADVHFATLGGRNYADLPIINAGGMDGAEVVAAAQAALRRVKPASIARIRLTELDANLRGLLDQRAIREAGEHLFHLDMRLDWAEEPGLHHGSAQLGALGQEFETFAATYPSDNLDKTRLLDMARSLLSEEGT